MIMRPANPKYRVLYAVWAFLEVIGFGGLLYGWGSLVYILKDEGIYNELCDYSPASLNLTMPVENASQITNQSSPISPSYSVSGIEYNTSSPAPLSIVEDKSCDARDARFNLVFTIGSAMFCVGCFLMGQINYSFGTRVTRIIAASLFVIGAVLIAFTSIEIPWLIFPGLSMIGGAGITFLVTNMQISLLFPRMGSVVVGIFCGGFDASTGIQLLIKLGYESGISRKTSYLILGGAHLLTFVSTFFFLPKDFIKKEPQPVLDDKMTEEKDAEVRIKLADTNKADEAAEDGAEEIKPSLMSQMLSPTYILHVYWLSVLQLRFYFLLGSLNTMLEKRLDSQEEVSRYTNETTYILMFGLITSPLAGAVYAFQNRFFASSLSPLRRNMMPTVFPLALTTVLGILMSAIILIETASAIYPVFVCLLFFRSFLYTMAAGLLSAIFPSEYFGIMYGIMFIVSGAVSMLQNVMFSWAEAAGFYQVNIFFLILMFTTFCHPVYQWWASRRAERSLSF